MPKPGRTTEVPRREARLALAKAREFLTAAESAAEQDHYDASLLNAVHRRDRCQRCRVRRSARTPFVRP